MQERHIETDILRPGESLAINQHVPLDEAMLNAFQTRSATFSRDSVMETPVDYYLGTVPHHEIERRRKKNKKARKSRVDNRRRKK